MWHLLSCLHASLKLISLSTDCPKVLQKDAIKKKKGSCSCDTRGFGCSENSWGYRQTIPSADSSISYSEDRFPDAVINTYPPGIRDPIRCNERSLTCFPALAEVGQTSFFLSSVWNRVGCALNMNQELDFMFVKVSTETNTLLPVLSICNFSIHCGTSQLVILLFFHKYNVM